MPFLRKYNTAITAGTAQSIKIPMVKRGVVDFAVSADWTPAAGDVKVSKDGGAAASIATLPAAVTMGNTAYWEFVFSGAELSCGTLVVTVADSATKAVEDQEFIIETYGNASAMYQADLSAANLPANVTQLLGTAWLTPAVAGTPDVNAKQIGGTAQTGLDLGANWTAARAAHLDADISSRMATFTLPTNFSSLAITAGGIAQADLQTIKTQAVTCAGGVTIPAATLASTTNITAGTITTATNLTTNNDKTGYSLSAGGVQAIWDALTSALTTVGSIGKRIVDYLGGGSKVAATVASGDDADAATLVTRLTSTRAGYLDNLSGGAVALASVWSAGEATKLDTIYGKLPTNAIADETLVISATSAILSAVGTPLQASGYTAPDNADIVLIKAKTDNLPGSPAAVGSAMTLTSGERDSIAAALLDLANGIETGKTLRQGMRIIAAALAGKRSNAGTATEQYDAIGAPGTARIVGNLDSSGDGTPTLTP